MFGRLDDAAAILSRDFLEEPEFKRARTPHLNAKVQRQGCLIIRKEFVDIGLMTTNW